MNIEQIKKDRERGIMISPGTWDKLIEAALMMEDHLENMSSGGEWSHDAEDAHYLLLQVAKL
jgi:hypothetical protein